MSQSAPIRSVVLMQGTLHGMGHRSPCAMLAIKEIRPDTRQAAYSRCSVIDSDSDLPDGHYTVESGGIRIAVRRELGLWLPTDGSFPSQA